MARVIGIDCGSNATGYGLIETHGATSGAIAFGVIRTRAHAPLPERLHVIFAGLSELITLHRPDAAAVEGIFHSVNARSALQLGQVRGVALLAAAGAGLTVYEYSPVQVKQSVVGYGHAEKSQVQEMVRMILRLTEHPPQDAADALAVALCHAHRSSVTDRIARAVSRIPARPPAVRA